MSVHPFGRYVKKNGDRYPLWCDESASCLKRGLIPTNLFQPEDVQSTVDKWIDSAVADQEPAEDVAALKLFLERKKRVSDRIRDIRSTVANYNLPYLSLPTRTDKAVALDVFIKMNTNSKPLSTYDIIVAEVESEVGTSLHDLVAQLNERHPEVGRYSELSDLVLTTSALLQGQLPNQRGAWDMDRRLLVSNWATLEHGLDQMATFLANEGVFDEQRLPTNAVLAPIAAWYALDVAASGDKRGQDELLLKKSVARVLYGSLRECGCYPRVLGLQCNQRVLRGERRETGEILGPSDVPIFAEHYLAEIDELLTAEWPKRASIRGRGILAVGCRLGAFDFSTGSPLTLARSTAGTITTFFQTPC